MGRRECRAILHTVKIVVGPVTVDDQHGAGFGDAIDPGPQKEERAEIVAVAVTAFIDPGLVVLKIAVPVGDNVQGIKDADAVAAGAPKTLPQMKRSAGTAEMVREVQPRR